jgi:hypothetical protein
MTPLWRRIIVDIIIFILACTAPWWLSFALAFIAAFFFETYAELIVLGLVLDWLYNAPAARFGDFQYAMAAVASLSFLFVSYLKTFIRFT